MPVAILAWPRKAFWGVISWLRGLRWRWRLALIALGVVFLVCVVVPAYIYYSRDHDPPDYGETERIAEMSYQTLYDSTDGMVNQTRETFRVIETGIRIDSETCFHSVMLYDPYPKRKVSAVIVGSTDVTLAQEETWRSQADLRLIRKEVMQVNLPIVNTAKTTLTYSAYENYPGWPYHRDDHWSYRITCDTDVPLQRGWTENYEARVVADDSMIEVDGQVYPCFKVVHTLADTSQGMVSGGGVGSTRTEYWYRENKMIGPVRSEDNIKYRGLETRQMIEAHPPAPLEWLESPRSVAVNIGRQSVDIFRPECNDSPTQFSS